MKYTYALSFAFFWLSIFGTTSSILAQNHPSDSLFSTYTNSYSSAFFSEKYHQFTLEHFVDNYYSNAHYQIETTGNFSQPDDYTFSFTGYNYKWNRYYYDGLRINSLSAAGGSLHKPLLFDKSLEFSLVDSRVDFRSAPTRSKYVYSQWNNGNAGDKVPWTNWYSDLMHGHLSGPQKAWQPIPERRKTRQAGLVYFSLPGEKHTTYGYFTAGRRMFTNFNYIAMDDYYGEDYLQFHLHSDMRIGSSKVDYLISYQQRDKLFSQYYYGRDETANMKNLNLSFLATDRQLGNGNSPLQLNTGIHLSHKTIHKNVPNFSRNVADQDGESLEPYYPSGQWQEVIWSTNGEKKLSEKLSFYFDQYNGLVLFSPKESTYTNSLYYENNLSPFTPLYVTEWSSEAFATGILENTAGIKYNTSSTSGKTTLALKANVTADAAIFTPESLTALNYELGMHVERQLGKKATTSVNLGRRRVAFDIEQVKFLSHKYQSGESYYWLDANNNRRYETDEKGTLFTTTGGKYHHASSNLKQPALYYLDYATRWRMGRRWELTLLAQYRKFTNQWAVEYTQPASSLGTFETYSPTGEDVFFLNGQQEANYRVVNDNKARMQQLAKKQLGWLFNSPFYGGLTLNLEKKTPNTYIYVSASAYEVVGISPMGNGVLTNNLGVLSESLANPNTYLQNLGRLDSDRAYIVRIYYHQNLSKKWKMAFQVKYKDGQPVNRNSFTVKSSAEGNQFAFWNQDIKGINPFTGQFGVREGGFWNYELRFQHRFKLWGKQATADLNIYNIMDVATPLNNYNFPEPDYQHALDLQIPRGFLLSFTYSF